MSFVGDASATLPWFFLDESTPWTDGLLARVQEAELMVVPAHWPIEVANVILMAQRRKRVTPGQAIPFFKALSNFNIEIEAPLEGSALTAVFLLAERHSLTIYDAAYLELAQRKHLPLATLDRELIQAALRDGSPLVEHAKLDKA